MSNITEKINAQIAANVAGQNWGKHYLQKGNMQEMKEALVRNRMELKHINYALSMNPAAAVFGESQVGKSYLVDNLLASKKGPLYIYDGHGNKYSFIDEINPLGNGKESTSLVSRFSTKKMWINDAFPVKASLLSPADIILMLCDTYFNDVRTHDNIDKEQLHKFTDDFISRYEGKSSVQKYITEVELYEMKQYFFEQEVLNRGDVFRAELESENFFEKIADVIESVSPDQWVDVFSILWGREQQLTEVFCKLINAYKQLDFKQEVYFKIDAILRKDGTLLHVDRLFELFGVSQYLIEGHAIDVEIARIPDMRVWNGTREVTLQKSEMCALTAEVVLKVTDKLEEDKPFLKQLDILDFPGARSRRLEDLPLSQATACQLLIRGKVAYLFNKYSQQYLISNLLFCHHRDQSNVTTLKGLLKGWVETMVGKTEVERTEYMRSARISPLFFVATKFNVDIEKDDKDISENEETRVANKEARWNTRFNNLKNIVGNDTEWFANWQSTEKGEQEPFKNTYLLRSYNFSCIKRVYLGYKKENQDGTWSLICDNDGNVIGETSLVESYKSFIPEIRKTFLENDFVKAHFANPEEAWIEGTGVDENGNVTPFHDGSDYIIRNLTISCQNVRDMRDKRFEAKVNETMHKLAQTLGGLFHDDNSDSSLREALSDAGEISILLDALFGSDKYFFSEFIDKILIRENELHDRVLDTINDNVMVEGTDISVLFAIRNRAKVDPELPREENVQRLKETYEKTTDKELDEELIRIGKTIMHRDDEHPLTVDEIINPPVVRNMARIIIDDVEKFWLDQYLNLENFEDFVKRGMSREFLDKLLKKMNVLFREKLRISDLMTTRIHKYVVNPVGLDAMAEMIADICAEMINRFVNTMGTAYFHDGHWNSLKDTIRHNNFNFEVKDYEFDNVSFDAEQTKADMNEVFDVFDNVDTILNQVPVDMDKLSYFSNYHAYRQWTDMMKLAFLLTCDIPTYDVNANNELRAVLLTHIVNSKELSGMLTREDYERYHMKSLIPED